MLNKRHLPSITALQCFEAVTRHLSFTRAAEELNLTQSAVSKQVAQLEELLQHLLFRRVRRRLQMTPAGDLYLVEVRKILSQVEMSTHYLRSYGGETEVLRVSTPSTFGARWLVPRLKHDFPGRFVGTSNVHLSRELDMKPLGTMAHEWIMAHQQLGPRLIDSQIAALDCWVREYRGLLGIALTDCITTDAFLGDFDLFFAKLFDGLRHDSGDPVAWGEKCIAHYHKLGIDPMSKTLVFSDSLTLPKSLEIFRALHGRINVSFGIGTNLTCDIPGVEPMSIVLKMTACNGQPVAKISDEPGKTHCKDPNFVAYLRHVFQVPAESSLSSKE